MQADDAGFADVLTVTFSGTVQLDRRLRRATRGISEVVDRAIAAGELRDDFVLEDLVVLLMANAGVVNATAAHAPAAWRRFVAYAIDSFRAPGIEGLPEPVPPRQLRRAMHRR